MKKKVAAIFMASIMACSMAACGSSGGSSDSGKTDSKDKSTASSTAENGSGEVEKIIVSFPTWTGAPADTEKVQEAINDITRDKIGVEIELSITDFGSFNQNTTLAVEAARQGKTLAYPVCGEGFSLTAAVPGPDGWEVGAYGIRTPILSRSAVLPPDKLDLVLVPCTAFDTACRRVLTWKQNLGLL